MVVVEMRWPGVTPAQYDEAKRRVDWEGNPEGAGTVHLAWFEGGALRCYDVWDSGAAFNAFVQNRLMPGLEGLGIEGPPEVRFHPAHDVFILPKAVAGAR